MKMSKTVAELSAQKKVRMGYVVGAECSSAREGCVGSFCFGYRPVICDLLGAGFVVRQVSVNGE